MMAQADTSFFNNTAQHNQSPHSTAPIQTTQPVVSAPIYGQAQPQQQMHNQPAPSLYSMQQQQHPLSAQTQPQYSNQMSSPRSSAPVPQLHIQTPINNNQITPINTGPISSPRGPNEHMTDFSPRGAPTNIQPRIVSDQFSPRSNAPSPPYGSRLSDPGKADTTHTQSNQSNVSAVIFNSNSGANPTQTNHQQASNHTHPFVNGVPSVYPLLTPKIKELKLMEAELVHQGPIKQFGFDKPRIKSRYLFLFSNFFILTKQVKQNKYRPRWWVALSPRKKVEDVQDSTYEIPNCELRVYTPLRTFIFFTSDPASKKVWIEKINQQIEYSAVHPFVVPKSYS